MNQIWQYWHAHLDDDTISNIIRIGDQYPIVDTGLGFDGSTNNNDVRKSEIRWINPLDQQSQFIADWLWAFAQAANRNAFGFHIDYLPDIQYTKYSADENGKYDWH